MSVVVHEDRDMLEGLKFIYKSCCDYYVNVDSELFDEYIIKYERVLVCLGEMDIEHSVEYQIRHEV